MLIRILDTTQIDNENSQIMGELITDLRRMDHLKHLESPDGCNAYKLRVLPSLRTYSILLHRFRFEIQYGILVNDKFRPVGKVVNQQTETLPMI
ncbi:hypothetical protein HYW75_02910 [Candidatus Pacearchaeota archaeon]|nr:hypothetical protein [Candidatus Pacearchaeota archaeon]